MTMPGKSQHAAGSEAALREDPAARARRIEDLKRRVRSGTYLIQRYEIIEGILDTLSRNAD